MSETAAVAAGYFVTHTAFPLEAELFEMIAEVLDLMGDEEQMIQVLGHAAATRLKQDGHLAHWQREAIAYRRESFPDRG